MFRISLKHAFGPLRSILMVWKSRLEVKPYIKMILNDLMYVLEWFWIRKMIFGHFKIISKHAIKVTSQCDGVWSYNYMLPFGNSKITLKDLFRRSTIKSACSSNYKSRLLVCHKVIQESLVVSPLLVHLIVKGCVWKNLIYLSIVASVLCENLLEFIL